MHSFRLINHRHYPWLFLGLAVAGMAVVFGTPWLGADEKVKQLVVVLGLAGGLTAFLYAQHRSQVEFFSARFREFNARYDRLNNRLNAILATPAGEEFSRDDKHRLFDYFNLCAEEYLYFKAGFIDETVWRAWVHGMRIYAKDPRVLELWREELGSESYYGFPIELLE